VLLSYSHTAAQFIEMGTIYYKERTMSDEIILNETNFENEVLQSDVPVLVDFWAEWCGPCKMLAPTIEELAREYKGRAKVAKLNVDEAPAVAEKYGIRSIPTLILFFAGEVVEQAVGVQSKANLVKMLSKKVS
jgi:thioredoxin 1